MRRAATIAGSGLLFLLFLLAAAILRPAAAAPVAPLLSDHVIANVHVVDVRRGLASAPLDVVIRGGRIATIGGVAPASLNRIDGAGGYLIPGLWDMHSHSWQLSPQLHFPLQIANGVIAVRDMMDCPGVADSLIACVADKRRWSAESEVGRLAAPRFIGIGSFYFESPEMTPDAARQLLREYRRRGLDYAKVYNRLSPATYRAVADEASRLAMPMVGHLPRRVPLAEALRLGQQGFDHAHLLVRGCSARYRDWVAGNLNALTPPERDKLLLNSFDPLLCDHLLAEMSAREAWLIPTHVTREEDARAGEPAFINDPRLAYADPLSRWAYGDDLGGTRAAYPGRDGEDLLKAYFEHGLQLTGTAHKSGVRVLAGTDTILGGFKLHDELGLLVAAGLTPAQALRAATLDAAEYARLGHDAGSIDPGKRADLILLRSNPLDSIGNTRAITAVFLGGRHYDRKRLDALLDYTKTQANLPANWIKMLWGFARSSVSGEL